MLNNLQNLFTDAACSISSLSRITLTALQLGYFISIFQIVVAVRLGFRSCQINKSRYDDRLELVLFVIVALSCGNLVRYEWQIFRIVAVTDVLSRITNFITYILLPLKLLLQLFIFVSVFFVGHLGVSLRCLQAEQEQRIKQIKNDNNTAKRALN